MSAKESKRRKAKVKPPAADEPKRGSNVRPLQSDGLTVEQMIERAVNTKPPKSHELKTEQ